MIRNLASILTCFLLASCHTATETPPSVANFPPAVSSIIQNNCMGSSCHSGSNSTNLQFDLSSWESMTKGSIYFNEVIPFSAVKSHLFGHINTNSTIGPVITPTMPFNRDHLSTADQIAFYNWINDGAKSNDGKIPYSTVTRRIFIPNQDENMISVLDASTMRWVRIINTGDNTSPTAVTMMPDNNSFIAGMDGAGGTIRKYDAAAYTSLGEFQSNLVPADITILPDGSKGYIADDKAQGNIGIFDPVRMKMLNVISTPYLIDPVSTAVTADGKHVYICGASSDDIICLDTKNDSVIACLTLGTDVPVPASSSYERKYFPRKILLSADSKTMYVSCYNTSEIVVFDLLKDSISARIPLQWNPWGLALTSDGAELWAAMTGTNQVNVIRTANNQTIATIDSVSLLPVAISTTPDGSDAYIACNLASGGVHHHATGGLPPSSFAVIDCKKRTLLSIQELPAVSTGVTIGYK